MFAAVGTRLTSVARYDAPQQPQARLAAERIGQRHEVDRVSGLEHVKHELEDPAMGVLVEVIRREDFNDLVMESFSIRMARAPSVQLHILGGSFCREASAWMDMMGPQTSMRKIKTKAGAAPA